MAVDETEDVEANLSGEHHPRADVENLRAASLRPSLLTVMSPNVCKPSPKGEPQFPTVS